jgi:glycosyltransferase involved in cell wall biosynthesis
LTFVKDQYECISKYVAEINALTRNNYYYVLKRKSLVDSSKIPMNISVRETPVFYLPLDSHYKKLGKLHFNAVDKAINKNGIDFDLIHSQFTWSSGYVGAKLKEKYDVPFVVTAHGYDIYSLPFKDSEWRKRIEYVLNSADHIITVSKSNLKCINKLDVSTPVTVIPNGYDSNKFYPRDQNDCRDQLNIPIDKSVLLTVGNLEEVKGQKYLIEAMQEIIKSRKDVLCYIVGSGPLESKLKKQILVAGLENYVKLVGAKPHSEIPIWMNACDVFVLPSLRESFGVVQIEAMACGKPVVATYNGGSEEIIVSEDYGLLVERSNSHNLSKMIEVGISKIWNRGQIIEYSKYYQWKNVTKQIHKIYSTVGQ